MTTGSQINSLTIIAALCSFFLLSSCDGRMVYENIEEVPDKAWKANVPVNFAIPVEDTISLQNILITVQNATNYKYSNLFLFVTTKSPSGATVCDTLEVQLADEKGRWYGKGFSRYYDLQVPYKHLIKFPLKGDYTISITQGMREESLEGIVKVGVRVEHAKIK